MIEEHRKSEMAFVYTNLLTPDGEIKIEKHEIKLVAELEVPEEKVDLGKCFVIQTSRVYLNTSGHEESARRARRAQ